MTSTCYPLSMESQVERLTSLVVQFGPQLVLGTKTKKRIKNMATTEVSPMTKEVRTTVFDLKQFDSIELGKNIQLPAKPQSLEEATQLFANDKQRMLDIIWSGLCAEAIENAENDKTGWHEFTEDGNLAPEEYSGNYADAEKKKQIDAMILNFAKAIGLWTPEKWSKAESAKKKNEARDTARAIMFENQAMMDMFKS